MSGDAPSNETFDTVGAGASKTVPTQCSALRKNGHVVIKGHPCKIVEMTTSKTGKHGHAKVNLVALDIFTGKKYVDICPSTHNMEVPTVDRKEYSVMGMTEDGYLSLLDDGGNPREDLKVEEYTIPNEIKEVEKLIAEVEAAEGTLMANVIKAMDIEAIVSFKKTT